MAVGPEPQIPLACLLRLTNTVGLLSMSFGSASLLLLLGLDVWYSKTKKTNWIRGQSFILGDISLQFVGLLYHPIVSISNTWKLDPKYLSELSLTIYSNQLLIISRMPC